MGAPQALTEPHTNEGDIEGRIADWLTETDPDFKDDPTDKPDRDTDRDGQPIRASEDTDRVEASDDPPDDPQGDEPIEEEELAADAPDVDPDEHTSETVETMGDLARMWDMKEDDVLQTLKVPGRDGELVPLSTALSEYRNPEALQAHKRELDGKRDEEHKAAAEQYDSLRVATDRLLTQIEQEEKLTPEQWKELEEHDPVEWLKRQRRLDNQKAAIGDSLRLMQEQENGRGKEQQAAHQTWLGEQVTALRDKAGKNGLPDWTNAAEGKAAEELIEAQLTSDAIGFSRDELNALEDHRYMVVAYYAAKYLETVDKARTRIQNVRGRVPKFVPEGARREPSRDGAKKVTQRLRRRLEQTGDERDAAKLIEGFL